MMKERHGTYNHQQIIKNIFKEMVEHTHGVQNVVLGDLMMLQHMMNQPKCQKVRAGKEANEPSNTTNAINSSPSAKLATIIKDYDANDVDFISFSGLVADM